MGNKNAKFQGPGKVLGTGEVVNAKKPTVFVKVNEAAQAAGGILPVAKRTKQPLTEAEKEDRRKAALAAADARERAWEERIAKQRAKREKEDVNTVRTEKSLAWNELSAPSILPPADPAMLRKQQEAAEQLKRSGFNPFQATMSSSATARSVLTTIGADETRKPDDSNASIEVMQSARGRLKQAMRGSDINELATTLAEAEKYGVPEVDEARELLLALTEASEESTMYQEEGWEEVMTAIHAFEMSNDLPERKAAASTVMQSLLQNLVDHPEDPKYRKIRLENKAIKTKIVEAANGTAVGILLSVGFEQIVDEEGQICLVVPDPQTLPPEVVKYAKGACEQALAKLRTLKF